MERTVKADPAERILRAPRRRHDDEPAASRPVKLQDQLGNTTVDALISSRRIQAKRSVSQPGDPWEEEADRVAASVVAGGSPPGIQRACTCGTGVPCTACEEEELVQRHANSRVEAASAKPSDSLLSSSGRPLDSDARGFFEDRFGRGFADVRIHTDTDAATATRALAADAFTTGSDIAFAPGRFAPETDQGRRLLAHELTHVVQQRSSGHPSVQRRPAEESTRSSITPEYAAGLSDTALDEHMRAVVAHARGIDPTSAEYTALVENLTFLSQERAKRTAKKRTRTSLVDSMIEWHGAGLLDPPFRPADVPEIPPLPVTAEEAERLGPIPLVIAGAAPKLVPIEPGPVKPPATRPPLRLVPPVEPVSPTAPVPGRVPLAVPVLVFLTVLLWPSETAPRWMDEMNPITGDPYGSPEEYEWVWRLTPEQREYLRRLTRLRRTAPDPTVDADTDPTIVPVPAPKPRPKEEEEEPEPCVSMDVPRRGGHARHDAYATKVTGSAFDYYVRTPARLAINYDGLRKPILVWEVKVGHGWFFNPDYAPLRDLTLAKWDVQKDLGLAVAAACGFLHLWTIPDRWVAALLNARWGGIPAVLSIPE